MNTFRVVDENTLTNEQLLSQEYDTQSYHEMQPLSLHPATESTITFTSNHPRAHPALDSRIGDPRVNNQSSSSTTNVRLTQATTTSAPVPGSPAKRRRTVTSAPVPPSSAPPMRRRFDTAAQNTAASQMTNLMNVTTSPNTRLSNSTNKPMTEMTQCVLAVGQTIKPLSKLCEETNQLMKDIAKQNQDQSDLLRELVNIPRELQKLAQQLSFVLHTQAKVLQTRHILEEDDFVAVLNGIDVSQVPRGTSLNATARSLVRAAYGEASSFNDLAPGEFDVLLDIIARLHGQHIASVFANGQNIKNSLQQMKHDVAKKKKSIQKMEQPSTQHKTISNDESSIQNDDVDKDF